MLRLRTKKKKMIMAQMLKKTTRRPSMNCPTWSPSHRRNAALCFWSPKMFYSKEDASERREARDER